jgi:hypothetical protein
MSKRVVLLICGAAACALVLMGLMWRSQSPSIIERAESPVASPDAIAQPERLTPGAIALKPPEPRQLAGQPRSPLADGLGAANQPPSSEPKIVYDLFRFFLQELGSYPAGENNAQWMNALRGANAERLAILPSDHPRLSADGSLRDAWGEPFFIHQISSSKIQIRSAGPDRVLFSADDLTYPENPAEN